MERTEGQVTMAEQIFIRHKVGWCPLCGAPILDSGQDDDPEKWEHAVAARERQR